MKINRFLFPLLYLALIISYFGFYLPNVYPHIDKVNDSLYQLISWMGVILIPINAFEMIRRGAKIKTKEGIFTAVSATVLVIITAITTSVIEKELLKPDNDLIQTVVINPIALPFIIMMFMLFITRIIDRSK